MDQSDYVDNRKLLRTMEIFLSINIKYSGFYTAKTNKVIRQ